MKNKKFKNVKLKLAFLAFSLIENPSFLKNRNFLSINDICTHAIC